MLASPAKLEVNGAQVAYLAVTDDYFGRGRARPSDADDLVLVGRTLQLPLQSPRR
jgi:hypothetical protein